MTRRRLARAGRVPVALGLVLCACAPAVADAATEREVVRLDASRQAPVVLSAGARPATLRLRFDLPAGAKQGPDRWYLLRLRYRLRFDRDSGRGFAWVTSDTNERTAAQVEYTTSRRGGRLFVRRTTVDLEHGQRERRSSSARDALTFTNYLQYEGVRPGANTWTIALEQSGGARVAHMELLGDSAIVETRRTPFPLTLTGAVEGGSPQVGERFAVTATLAAQRGRPVRDIVLRARPPEGGGVELVGPETRRVGRLDGARRSVTFSFRARRPGSHAIVLTAGSDANDPNASVKVEVLRATAARSAPATDWALMLTPALAMAAWLAISRRRRRRAP